MILTSHRLDCLRLCLDLLDASGSLPQFDHVALLLNGVEGRHLRYVNRFMAEHPGVNWETVAGPRGRGERISSLQNECVRRHPGCLYFKIDEDTFVAPGWAEKLRAAYDRCGDDPGLSLITPVIPNNSAGAFFLLHAFPELGNEYDKRFGQPRTPYVNGPVATYPQIGAWLTRRFLSLRDANAELAAAAERIAREWRTPAPCMDPDTQSAIRFDGAPPHLRFGFRFSINCICYDYRHWQEIGGVPKQDEIGWGDWIRANNKYIVLATDILVHHYSFFVQQDWLDRTMLLEELRAGSLADASRHYGPWLARLAKQAPRVLKRRLLSVRR